jgi:hypothetical protein
MAQGRKRGAEKFGHVKTPKVRKPSSKDLNRAAASGRAEQGLGTAGRPGGTKSSGGKEPPAKVRVGRRIGSARKAGGGRGTK